MSRKQNNEEASQLVRLNVEERLSNALTIDKNSFYETIEGKDGTKTEISKKVYEFATPIGNRNQITVYDSSIIESTEKIAVAMKGRSILNYVICKEFSNIADSGKLENMGFKNIAEYGKAIFGLETSTVNHYARIGRNFIDDDYKVKAGLPELSTSHFIELNALVPEDGDLSGIVELYATGKLVDGMSTKVLRSKIKELKQPALEDKGEIQGEAKETSENTATVNETIESNESNESSQLATEKTQDTEISTTQLENEFDPQVVIGQIISSASRITELFSLLNRHEISVIGYGEHIDALKALAKELL